MWTAPLICERRVLIPASKHRAKLMTTIRVVLCGDCVYQFCGPFARKLLVTSSSASWFLAFRDCKVQVTI